MTKMEAILEHAKIHNMIKDWRANDKWHKAMYARQSALQSYWFGHGKDPGPWEIPPVPEGVEP